MQTSNLTDPYAGLKLRKQVYLESRAMAEFALSKGKAIDVSLFRSIERFEAELQTDDLGPVMREQHDIEELLTAHQALVKIIEPATPLTILLLDVERKTTSWLRFFGPVSVVRQMMAVAIISLATFIFLSTSDVVAVGSGNIFKSNGVSLLINLAFFLASAAMGASFAALYKANSYITSGTFDPNYQASYWIRFFLGLISGVVLAVMISENALKGNELLVEGIARPLLAILGGFSADLVYTLLSRMVETLRSLFLGSTENMVAVQAQEANAKLASQKIQYQMKLAADVMSLQQEIGVNTSAEDIQLKLNNLLGNLLPVERGHLDRPPSYKR